VDLINKMLKRAEEGNEREIAKLSQALREIATHHLIGEQFVATYIISKLKSLENSSLKSITQKN
jgi:hypothetical protein